MVDDPDSGRTASKLAGHVTPASSSPVADTVSHESGFACDIEDRIAQLEAANRRSFEAEEKYRRMYDNLQDVYVEATLDGTMLEMTSNIEMLSRGQYKREDLIGKSVNLFYADPKYREAILLAMNRQGRAIDMESVFKNRDGSLIPCSISATIVHTADGTLLSVGTLRDITERKRAEALLRENNERLDLALRSSNMGVWHWDITDNRRHFDEQACRLLGIDPVSFAGAAEALFAAVHPDDRDKIKAAMTRTIEQGALYEPEFRSVWPDGSVHYVTSRGNLICDDGGRPARIMGIIWDITERKQAEERIARLHQLNELLLNSTAEGIYGVNLDGRCTFVNPAALSILGFNKEEVIENNPHQLFHHHHEDGSPYAEEDCPTCLCLHDGFQRKVESAFTRKNGDLIPVQMSVAPMHENGKLVGVEVVFQDIAYRKAMEQELLRLATTDPLTGVSNRRHFIEQMEMELARIKRSGEPASFLMVDIDHFKNVNDTYGHATGDTVLQHLARLSQLLLRRNDLFGRLGGEEFGILLPSTDGAAALEFAERFRRHVADTPAQNSKGMIPFTISIGAAEFAPSDSASDGILARADAALYRAKEGGRNRVEVS